MQGSDCAWCENEQTVYAIYGGRTVVNGRDQTGKNTSNYTDTEFLKMQQIISKNPNFDMTHVAFFET